MIRLRPYKSCDAETIVSWITDETILRKWSADRFDHYPISAEDLNRYYAAFAASDNFYPEKFIMEARMCRKPLLLKGLWHFQSFTQIEHKKPFKNHTPKSIINHKIFVLKKVLFLQISP